MVEEFLCGQFLAAPGVGGHLLEHDAASVAELERKVPSNGNRIALHENRAEALGPNVSRARHCAPFTFGECHQALAGRVLVFLTEASSA